MRDTNVLGMLETPHRPGGATSLQRDKSRAENRAPDAQLDVSSPCGLPKGRSPGPVWAVQAQRWDTRNTVHASTEPFPRRSGSHCNTIKHTLILLSSSHSPLLLPGKDRASSHAVLHAAKKSKKVWNVLCHLRCKTFLLGLKCGDKQHLEHSCKHPENSLSYLWNPYVPISTLSLVAAADKRTAFSQFPYKIYIQESILGRGEIFPKCLASVGSSSL